MAFDLAHRPPISDPNPSSWRGFAAASALALVGCVSGEPRGGSLDTTTDLADTNTEDSLIPSDGDTVVEDSVAPPDTEVTPDTSLPDVVPDAVGPSCIGGRPCDNGTGPAAGSCSRGYMTPGDLCDEGTCRDQTIGPDTSGYALDGTWTLVLTSVGPEGTNVKTLRAELDIAAGGSVDISKIESSDAIWLNSLLGDTASGGHSVCLGGRGELSIELGDLRVAGTVDATGAIMVGGAPRIVAIGVRRDGDDEDVDGTYQVVQMGERIFPKELNAVVGQVGFVDGCLETGGFLVDDRGERFVVEPGQDNCLNGKNDDYTVDFAVRLESAVTALPAVLRVTVAQGGTLLIGTFDGPAGGVVMFPGLIVLSRLTDVAPLAMLGSYGFASLKRTDRVESQRGHLDLVAGGTTGEVWVSDEPVEITGGWFATAAKRQYAHRFVTADGAARHASGWVAQSGNAAFLIHVASVGPAAAPSLLPPSPVAGGALFMVKRGTTGEVTFVPTSGVD